MLVASADLVLGVSSFISIKNSKVTNPTTTSFYSLTDTNAIYSTKGGYIVDITIYASDFLTVL